MRQNLTSIGPCGRPCQVDFEIAYQVRVALDRIRFAIKHIEQFAESSEQVREVSLQLLDALDRLGELDHNFQIRSRIATQGEMDGGCTYGN